MASLTDKMNIIREVIAAYAKDPVGGHSYLMESTDGNVLSIIDVYEEEGKRQADTGLIVRITGTHIIVERDMNNKPLVDALVQAGIPREKIILAYAGEPVPETV